MSFGIQNILTRVATGLISIRATESRLVGRLTMTRGWRGRATLGYPRLKPITITEPPFPNWPPFPNFFLQPQSLRYFPILNYGIFLVAVADICVIFLIFYMSKQLYTTLNTGSKMRDFTYYWMSRAFLATPAFPNFMIYSNVVRYVKSQASEYSETICMSARKYKF